MTELRPRIAGFRARSVGRLVIADRTGAVPALVIVVAVVGPFHPGCLAPAQRLDAGPAPVHAALIAAGVGR